MDTGTDWTIDAIARITDGDTVRLLRRRTFPLAETLLCDVYDRASVAIRLINLDTPERGQDGYNQARDDISNWLDDHPDACITTWPGGGFDRLLGDIWAGDRGNTLSQWMLRDRGWQPYVEGT